ncbi:thioredoxin domain-containing protein [Hydrogenophaga sp.]|uniref:thioredoxin domain-containing protein n=1 Tax=Hydrogenophaga sp. TaxID=1904254 RepID=UPI00286D876D|nr:thioredoxin domain-containing protein [Hydrogenophaga sp.]
MLQRRHLTLGLLASTAALALAACGQATDSTKKAPITPDQSMATLAAEGKGFTVGASTAARTVYVLFDPQCPHCAHLWLAAEPLLAKARFVWMPVAFISAKSLPQGAALLQAAQPQEAMSAHEHSLLGGGGGIGAPSDIPAELEAAIKTNTLLLDRLGAESVPFIVARSASGQPVLQAGAMDTAALAALLGLQ